MAALYDKTFVSTEVDAKPKRIVICCDGTWQSATSLDPTKGCSSNVTRLSRVLANAGKDQEGNEWQQLVYYDAGIGTGDIGLQKKLQGGLGKGLIENILEAYNFICNNYRAGDELFFFGFSRGAYTVRATAGLVCQIGVLKPSSMTVFIELYNQYKHKVDDEDISKPFSEYPPWQEFTKNSSHAICTAKDIRIKVIGVWDTVGALGIPALGHLYKWWGADTKAYQLYDTTLNDRILYAYQALALDERRESFAPAVWKLPVPLPVDPKKPDGERKKPVTNLCQCWFPGAHVNVGGGSSSNAGKHPKGDREQLASVSYAWMLDRIRPHLALSETALSAQIAEFKRMATFTPEEEKWSIWNATRFMKNTIADTSSKVLPAGYGIGEIDDSHSPMYWLMANPKEREPNFNNSAGKGVPEKEKVVSGKGKDVLEQGKDIPEIEQYFTVERIHPSVYWRQKLQEDNKLPPYVPAALQGWKRIETTGKGRDGQPRTGVKWVKKVGNDTVDEMWEFEIGNFPEGLGVEQRFIEASLVKGLHEAIGKAWRK